MKNVSRARRRAACAHVVCAVLALTAAGCNAQRAPATKAEGAPENAGRAGSATPTAQDPSVTRFEALKTADEADFKKDKAGAPAVARPAPVTSPTAAASAAPQCQPGDPLCGAVAGAAGMRGAGGAMPLQPAATSTANVPGAKPSRDGEEEKRGRGDSANERSLRARLDPNARYATTYRPGGAMLAAFDAAVSRGALPAGYRELVADFGGRYAPAMESPRGQALAFRVETERAQVAPAGGFLHLRVAMRSSDESPGRSPLSVHLVLDVSGSMGGAPIENAKRAAKSLVERLAPTDTVSITTFSSSAQVLVPTASVGPRRRFIGAQIDSIVANGGTNISSGLDLGYAEARKAEASASATKIVMLLSDGMANGGDTNRTTLADRGARALADGIQTSTFGVGDSFDAALMATVADRGAGGYYYLKDSSQIAAALSTELEARLQPVAQAVEVRLRLKPDVAPVRVYGSRELGGSEAQNVRAQEIAVDANAAKKAGIARDRQEDAEGGMRFFMPAFARADRHAMLIELALPPGAGERSIGSVEVRYKDVLRKKNVTEEIAVRTPYATSDAESAKTTNASVVATMQAFSAGDSILRASELAGSGMRAEASRALRERAELLTRAAGSLSEPRLTEDATRLARLATIVAGETKIDPVPLAILLRGSAYGYLR